MKIALISILLLAGIKDNAVKHNDIKISGCAIMEISLTFYSQEGMDTVAKKTEFSKGCRCIVTINNMDAIFIRSFDDDFCLLDLKKDK